MESELKERIVKDIDNKLAQEEIKLRIAKAGQQNQDRIKKMKSVNSMIENLYGETLTSLHSTLAGNATTYKTLMKKLII